MESSELVHYLNQYLQIDEITDYGPQGLQVEAAAGQVTRIALAVDVAPAIISDAAEWGAEMLLVHHGVLWRNVERLAGPLGERVRLLLQHNMHLYAAHLALDAHPVVGNNAILAERLQVQVEDWWCAPKGTPLAVIGAVQHPVSLAQFTRRVNEQLAVEARVLAHGPNQVQRVAILSGFGADQVMEAAALGADTFVTGETSHANYWAASDHGLNVIYAGHYATETVGVQALGAHLAERFDVDIRFFHFPTAM